MPALESDTTISSAPRVFYLDMNAFFASVEQQEKPALRGKPMIVVPVMSKTGCAIAASYEAKAYGIKTGTRVGEALALCPQLKVVKAQPKIYLQYHNGIVEVLSRHFSSPKVMSIDELSCTLSDWQQRPDMALEMAAHVKKDLRQSLGECLKCSVGVAPNIFLAKIASDMVKPDGLTMLMGDYTQQLFRLVLRDLPGIGPAMEKRLHSYGVRSVAEIWSLNPQELCEIWDSQLGEAWYYMMRGSLRCDYGRYFASKRKSISHSHVFAPQFRNVEGTKKILARLLSKTLLRLRREQMLAGGICVSVSYRKAGSYRERRNIRWKRNLNTYADDDFFWIEVCKEFMDQIPNLDDFQPTAACIVLFNLNSKSSTQLNLFENRDRYSKLAKTMDVINQRYGHVLDLAPSYFSRQEAPVRIGFRKTD